MDQYWQLVRGLGAHWVDKWLTDCWLTSEPLLKVKLLACLL